MEEEGKEKDEREKLGLVYTIYNSPLTSMLRQKPCFAYHNVVAYRFCHVVDDKGCNAGARKRLHFDASLVSEATLAFNNHSVVVSHMNVDLNFL